MQKSLTPRHGGRSSAVKPGGVAADAAAEISVETVMLITGSNEDLTSSRAHVC